MMVISMLNYQADEYMEAVVGTWFSKDLESVKVIIRRLCSVLTHPVDANSSRKRSRSVLEDERAINSPITPIESPMESNSAESSPSLRDVEAVLFRFTSHVLNHNLVLRSPPPYQEALRRELATFLLAHITHAEDSLRLSKQQLAPNITNTFNSPSGTYFEWVRTTSADHTSCPYSFAFLSCLISQRGEPCFHGVRQKYLAQDLCRHLASMCRQYNDYGSIERDRAEKNLNSVNFPEFSEDVMLNDGGSDGEEHNVEAREAKIKEALFWVAEYERQCLGLAIERLEKEVKEETKNALRVFISVTDLYGQIYVAKDIASRMK
jgi:hypothetical protein